MTSTTEIAEIAKILAIPTRRGSLAPTEFAARIEAGFKPETVARFVKAVTPDSAALTHLIVPKATLTRRLAKHQRLTADESSRLARAARVWAHALAIWKAPESAREFLLRPHPMLDGRRPLEMAIATDVGAEVVDQLLGRLEYGSAA